MKAALFRKRFASRSEKGFMMVFFALIITAMLGFAGMAVDLGNWYLHIQRAQRAADSAALAGAAYLPGDPPSANIVATETLQSEGFGGSVVKMEPITGRPNLMGVRVQEKTTNVFFKFFKVNNFTFNRAAVAGYKVPLKLGSPNNVAGMETSSLPKWGSANTIGAPGFSLYNTASVLKNQGDRWGAQNCLAGGFDGCSGTTNKEHLQERTFVVHIDEGTTGHLVIQSYDGGYYPVQDCETDAHAKAAWAAYPGRPSYDPSVRDACTKDGPQGGTPSLKTVKYQVKTLKGDAITECPQVTYNPLPADAGTDWVPLLASTAPHSPGASYRNWDTFCEFDLGSTHPAGNYEIKINANDSAKMYNAYSLRAAIVNSGVLDVTGTKKIRVYAKDQVTVNIHDQQEKARMPVVQIDRSWMGSTVKLEIYDLGDLPNPWDVTPYIRLVPAGWSNISDFKCRYSSFKDPPQWIQPCQLTNIGGGVYSGRVMTFEIEIPNNASCDWTNDSKCWVMAETDYGAFYSLVESDTVSYKLVDNGSPMRLYNASQFGF